MAIFYSRNYGGLRNLSCEYERDEEEKMMSSILIKDTTKEERIALIKSWIPHDDGLEDCDIDLWDMYADYINGKREIAEINMSFEPKYVEE